jgi:hypothetical protein
MASVSVNVRGEVIAEWQDDEGVGIVFATFVGSGLQGITAIYRRWDELG